MKKPIQQGQFATGTNGKAKAVDLDELHNIFIQNVSHELRTPLSIVQGYAELLEDGTLGELTSAQAQATQSIVVHVRALRTVVERIGILLAAKANETVSVPISLPGLVANVVDSRRAAIDQAGLKLHTHLEQDVPLVLGDPYQLQPALDCLLDNAVKFTPKGGQITVQLYTEPRWMCIDVSDTGIGIPQEEIDRIFNPFYQIDGSTTRRHNGLGLGLSIVKTVIADHGGQVSVASEPGQGSCVTVKLPTTSSETQVSDPSLAQDTSLRRILVVDDELNVALTIQDGLEKLPNCQVVVCTDGVGALQLFEQSPFDLLITDYRMPGTDGMTLSARVRQQYPTTRIIMITAYSSHSLLQQARDHAIQRVLDKPVKLDEIRSVALEALDSTVQPKSNPPCAGRAPRRSQRQAKQDLTTSLE